MNIDDAQDYLEEARQKFYDASKNKLLAILDTGDIIVSITHYDISGTTFVVSLSADGTWKFHEEG